MLGRKVVTPLDGSRLNSTHFTPQDNSDHQYRTFRDNVPVLFTLVAAFLALKAVCLRLLAPKLTLRQNNNLHLVPFIIGFGILMLLGLHGSSAPKVLSILYLNYLIAKSTSSSKLSPVFTWVFNAAVLFAADKYSGFPYASLHSSLKYLVSCVCLLVSINPHSFSLILSLG